LGSASFNSVASFVFSDDGAQLGNQVAIRGLGKDLAMKRYFGLVFVAGILAGSMLMSADEAVSLTVRPTVATYRGNAQVKVLVARNDANRMLIWEVDGPNYYRSSTMELDGASSPRIYFFMARDLPAGDFQVRATVRRSDRSVVMDSRTMKVVGGPN
jgi:hypothetical protein